MTVAINNDVYLRNYLLPFAAWLDMPDVTEILVNCPGEVWIERTNTATMERHSAPEIDAVLLQRLAHQIARISHQGISRETPLLSATLQNGARVQIIAPPATRQHMALAIRKHVLTDLTLNDYAATGGFGHTRRGLPGQLSRDDAALTQLLDSGDILGFLRSAVAARKTILLSGGTSSGKTTLVNALLKEISEHERVIVIEDTPEIKLGRDNALGLVAVYGDQGEARVTIDDLLRASMRMRPDRLLVGELRGPEAVTFLRAINTGHPGSLATIHASSAQGAYEQIALMCLQAGLGLSREETIAHAKSMVEVVVQLGRTDGVRGVDEIIFTRR
jgi:type IV secretion system protein VirB11